MARLTDKYHLGARIGGGGMAEVLQGTALGVEGFARPVAIKRILPALSQDPAFGSMFIGEARLASLLHHPNVVSVLDFDRDHDGSYFLVMELVQGLDLRALLDSGPLPAAVAAHVVGEVLQGLSYAHELMHEGKHLGIIHRDISPHNVMISWDGSVKVVDFGIAKAVRSSGASLPGALKGKAAYMSPEQAVGRPLDGRTDLFPVGVIFHEMLCGTRLFQGSSDNEILSRVINQPIANPVGPADFAQVCMKLLAREPRDRYRSARAALEDLLGCGSASPRASLELQEILRSRFADRAPRIPTGIRARDSYAADTRSLRGQSGSRPAPVAPVVSARTVTGPTPTAAGQRGRTRTASRATAAPDPRHRSSMWILGGLSFLAAAGVILFSLLNRCDGADPSRGAASERTGEVADVAVPAPDTTVVQAQMTDAAPAQTPADAGPISGNSTDHRADARVRKRRPARGPEPAREKGTLEIRVQPWARVLVAGKYMGTTPVTLELPVGSQAIVLENASLGRRETVSARISADKSVWVRRQWSP